MEPFADEQYYEDNFGDPPARLGALLARASRLIRAECPDVDQRIADGDLDPDVVADIVCEMVQNFSAIETPGVGVESNSLQQSAGPYQMTTTAKYSSSAGAMIVNRKHRRLLGCSRQQAFMIDLAPPGGEA